MVRALRDAGMEVIYTGLFATPEQIAQTAVDEDVDVVAVSLLNGAHMSIFPKIVEELRKREADWVAVVGGGIIPPDDAEKLEKEWGITGNFGPGTPLEVIVNHIRERGLEAKKRKTQ